MKDYWGRPRRGKRRKRELEEYRKKDGVGG